MRPSVPSVHSSHIGKKNTQWLPEKLCVSQPTYIQRITISLAMKSIHGATGAMAWESPGQTLSSQAAFECTPINISPFFFIEAIYIFGKIPQCWPKNGIYPRPSPRPSSLPALSKRFLPLAEPFRGTERRNKEWKESGSKRNVSERPPRSLSHYGIHQTPHIHLASKGLLSCKVGVWLNWGAWHWRLGSGLV